MPRSTREWALRKLTEAHENLNWCGFHLNEVYQKYNPTHPEIGQPIEDIMTVVNMLMEGIVKIRKSF